MTKKPRKKLVSPRNEIQTEFIHALNTKPIVINDSLWGTGKTIVSIGWAMECLYAEKFSQIILTKNVCNLTGILGYSPGSILEKSISFLKPQVSYVRQFAGTAQEFDRLLKENLIEFIPIELVQGESYNSSCIILDEAQNCTEDHIINLLTRLGRYSSLLILGDRTQSKLKDYCPFAKLFDHLEDKDVGKIHMGPEHVLRHKSSVRIYNKMIEIFNP